MRFNISKVSLFVFLGILSITIFAGVQIAQPFILSDKILFSFMVIAIISLVGANIGAKVIIWFLDKKCTDYVETTAIEADEYTSFDVSDYTNIVLLDSNSIVLLGQSIDYFKLVLLDEISFKEGLYGTITFRNNIGKRLFSINNDNDVLLLSKKSDTYKKFAEKMIVATTIEAKNSILDKLCSAHNISKRDVQLMHVLMNEL